MNVFFQILISGWIILVAAIIMNALLNAVSWQGWYGYFKLISQHGFLPAHEHIPVLNLLFLYVGYPFVLGLCAYLSKNIL